MRKVIVRVGELLVVLFLVSLGVFALLTRTKTDPAVAALGPGNPKRPMRRYARRWGSTTRC